MSGFWGEVFERPPVFQDPIGEYLNREGQKAIRMLDLEDSIYKLTDEASYDELYGICQSINQKIKARVVLTHPCGSVIVDTSKTEGNTYDNYMKDQISENHSNRLSIFQAQYEKEGFGQEIKYSTTLKKRCIYVAIRLGKHRNNFGTLRLSRIVQI